MRRFCMYAEIDLSSTGIALNNLNSLAPHIFQTRRSTDADLTSPRLKAKDTAHDQAVPFLYKGEQP